MKVPKKRGRKPKVKVEITTQSALVEEEKKEVIEKEKPKRGRNQRLNLLCKLKSRKKSQKLK